MEPLAGQFDDNGYAIVPQCLSPVIVQEMLRSIEEARQHPATLEAVSNRSGVYALRNLSDVIPNLQQLVQDPEVVRIVHSVIGHDAFMTRATLFDKTDGANWGVFWHQDLSIAVKARHEVEGFHAWTRKAGVLSVQPPAHLMGNVLAVRLHLDDCYAENGALKVLPGSHRNGRLCAVSLDSTVKLSNEVICEVSRGGAVLMNPLTLHASSPMTVPGHRRVIHLEFAAFDLPSPLQWQYRIPCR
ncbi:MAG: phytanoyl-CoA dioxygenase family protein [Planctomycetaceae bacterium]